MSVEPPLLDLMVKSLKEVNGDALVVEEDEIMGAFLELGGKGFFVEPSSAVAYAGYKKHLRNKDVVRESSTVMILTGHGLKTPVKPNS